jgi:hypothetical protein
LKKKNVDAQSKMLKRDIRERGRQFQARFGWVCEDSEVVNSSAVLVRSMVFSMKDMCGT